MRWRSKHMVLVYLQRNLFVSNMKSFFVSELQNFWLTVQVVAAMRATLKIAILILEAPNGGNHITY